MAYHEEKVWEVQDEVREIQRKIALLMAEGTPKQRAILVDAQRDLAEWEQQHVHNIRQLFEQGKELA